MFTCGLYDRDRGASVLHHCQAGQQVKPADDSLFRGGPTPSIHNALMELPLHSELVYQELQTDLKKAIQDHAAAVFQKIKQDAEAYNFSDTIPTTCNTGLSAATGSAAEVLRQEHPSGISFGITDGTLDGDSGIVSGIAIPSHTSADHEAEDSDVVTVVAIPAPEYQALVEIPGDTKPVGSAPRNFFKLLQLNRQRLSALSSP